MDMQSLLAPDTGTPLGETRSRVLDLLRSAGGPLGVREVSGPTGLHPNTARFHLDGLVEAGLATREPRPRTTPGRPSMAYRARDGEGPTGLRRYRLLAEMLTSLISGVVPNPGDAAAEAGHQWGRYLTEAPAPYERQDAGEAIEKLAATMNEIGFASEIGRQGSRYQLFLRRCPFREVAERHQDVVCALHLGLIQGVLEEMRAPVAAERLQPFAEPSLCIAELSAGPQSTSAPRRARARPRH